jgi:predicted dehydrogenase
LHHDVAIEAARAGEHIFCEKPQALNSEQAREMYEEAEKAGVKHYVNHNYRRCSAVRLAR